ncbi:molybdate ABC transporter substrate-binding protein [Neptuniibacter sp.]|uniref:molybdate ABC transporter substrate-binding protein n=1 Tax=Neptuniibacter sp. TaxID=1962643 RepID=UPI00260E63A2|nr:molybdate ABC transporter substrate-binding protein [Neptuniibacter sp.]MCP4596206.1 molybdate ABC transporter substrate-binding protein [Neptuniibacter sp.]
MLFRSALLFLSTILLPSSVLADKLNIAVASNFIKPMREIVQAFETTSDHKINLSFASSGKIYAQINHGAPFHIFLSADQDKPLALEENGMAVKGSRFTYATGMLVLWSTSDAGTSSDLITRLKQGEFRKLALANPKLAPYGRAAAEVLDSMGLTEQTHRKWVLGENIAQTYQFVRTGNADMGFVALSQARDGEQTHNEWIIPENLYRPIHQDLILLNNAEKNAAAEDFIKFIRSQAAQKIIESYGYKTF